MLFTHTSGLAWPQSGYNSRLWESFAPDAAPSLTEWVPQFLIPGGLHYEYNLWKNTEPGKFELYSNTGTCLLAYIVEQISGKDYRDYCKENIFDPLEMFNTSYYYSPLDPDKLATLYLGNNSIVHPYDDRLFASGLLKTTVEDLSHFLMAYINKGEYNGNQLLKHESVDNLLTIKSLTSGICLLWRARLGGWYGHTGGTHEVSSMAEMQKDHNVGLLIFCNKHNSTVYPGHEIYGLVRQKANEYINQ
jgi:CubicO group peptidase (beta-lactamase class C family)